VSQLVAKLGGTQAEGEKTRFSVGCKMVSFLQVDVVPDCLQSSNKRCSRAGSPIVTQWRDVSQRVWAQDQRVAGTWRLVSTACRTARTLDLRRCSFVETTAFSRS
jgi:hypothetical protein